MIARTYILRTRETDPVKNLALEAALLERVPADACILYLWQNAHTVVIGRNQNAWGECRAGLLREEGGRLVRRLSGGGAVYHDLGNLNFTFLTPSAHYDLPRQQEVILRAVRSFSLDARATGRNDMEISGRKFSGNAFYHKGGKSYHHGTLLVDVDMERLTRYLSVDAQKLSGKGVSSVRARVVNLRALCGEITPDAMAQSVSRAFGQVYGLAPDMLDAAAIDQERLRALEAQFANWQWIYGRPIPFTWRGARRFEWGGLEINWEVRSGHIAQCICYSDALDETLPPRIAQMLSGCKLTREAIGAALAPLFQADARIAQDVQAFLDEQEW